MVVKSLATRQHIYKVGPMITRVSIVAVLGVALAACQPAIPDSGRGVGFDGTFEAQQAERDRALAASGSVTGTAMPAPPQVASVSLEPLNDGSPATLMPSLVNARSKVTLHASPPTGRNTGSSPPKHCLTGVTQARTSWLMRCKIITQWARRSIRVVVLTKNANMHVLVHSIHTPIRRNWHS